jgi:glycosyltransferase involved in cell wall biosynthesis
MSNPRSFIQQTFSKPTTDTWNPKFWLDFRPGTAVSSFADWLQSKRPIPLWVILLVAAAVHGPLLAMKIPDNSFDANFHMSMASHYAHHWFNPWNEKQLGGFSQTTYPPMAQQWVGLLSLVFGLTNAYMLFQFVMLLLLPVAIFHYAKLWVDERSASYGALFSIFLGSLALLCYQDGQLGTLSSTPLYLLSFPFLYQWLRTGNKIDFLRAFSVGLAAAAAHHATLLFGSILFVVPVFSLVLIDRDKQNAHQSTAAIFKRAFLFFSATAAAVVVVLLPYFLAIRQNPIRQTPIPHQSRANYLLEPIWGLHYWIIPFGFIILALPFIFWRGTRERRLLPLFAGFYMTLIFGLGGTTPIPRLVLGRAFEILTYERFTFWATLMTLPFVGLLAVGLIDRFLRKAFVGLAAAAVLTCAVAVGWNVYFPVIAPSIDVKPILSFLNSNGHDQFRYMTLGFGNQMSKIAARTNAASIDGEYNSARWIPEIVSYGSAQLSSAKYFGADGMEALRSVLKHADRYGLKYIFVHDRYYEPLLTFAGWRQIDTYNHGEITVWSKPGVPLAKPIPSPYKPPAWQGILWGILPFSTSLFALVVAIRYRKLGTPGSEDKAKDPEPRTHDVEREPSPVSTFAQVQSICLVTAFPPGRGDLNEYGFHLATQLQRLPHVKLTVVADYIAGLTGDREFPIERCWKFNDWKNAIHICKAVRNIRPEVVWFNIGFSTFAKKPVAALLSLMSPALCRSFGYRTHITLHTFLDNVNLRDAGVRFPMLYKIGGQIAMRLLLMADDVTVLLPSYREALIHKYGAKPERVHYRPHGVFTGCDKLQNRAHSTRVLAFGNWGTYKRVESLVEAMKAVVREVPEATLVIGGGDHPNAKGYIAAAKQRYKDLSFVEFLGYVPEQEIEALFDSAALVVMPYASGAGASGVAHQACAYGLPIVSSSLPDFREMAEVEGMAVKFYDSSQPGELARSIVELLIDRGERVGMAEKNYSAAIAMRMSDIVADYVRSFMQPGTLETRPNVSLAAFSKTSNEPAQ